MQLSIIDAVSNIWIEISEDQRSNTFVASDDFSTFGIFYILTENKNTHRLCVGHRYPGIEHEHVNMLKIQNV